MATKTPWFYCGKCGFRNHPRPNQDNSKCEQCGTSNDDKDAREYDPSPAQAS